MWDCVSMACLDMFNNEQQTLNYTSSTTTLNPRISFSSDLGDSQYEKKSYREEPVSSDFEFSVRNYSMIPADEIFRKGVMLPLKENCTKQLRKMTLREELLVDEEEESHNNNIKSSFWWKQRLGLKRSTHFLSNKKSDSNIGVLQGIVEDKTAVFVHAQNNTGIVD